MGGAFSHIEMMCGVCMCVCMWTYVCVCVCMLICVCVCSYVDMCVCVSNRYIYKLADLHEHDHSYTEAGFTLLLHIKKLQVWGGGVGGRGILQAVH